MKQIVDITGLIVNPSNSTLALRLHLVITEQIKMKLENIVWWRRGKVSSSNLDNQSR